MSNKDLSPRLTALKIVTEVTRRNRPFDEVFEQEIIEHRGEGEVKTRDRAFIRMLSTVTLRRLGQIDDILVRFLDRPLPDKAAKAADILRLGTTQIIFMNTPSHAAVDTSVRLADMVGMGGFRSLINAVLRKVSREGEAIVNQQNAAKLNTPEWLWNNWNKNYGDDICQKIARANLLEPALDITVKDEAERDLWAKELGARILPTGSLRLDDGGAISSFSGFHEGKWWVQDAAAALPVKLLGNVKGLKIADLCAAPGGKTAQLAAQGAIVTALDRSDKRMKILGENLARLGLSAEQVATDAEVWWEGVLRRNPKAEPFEAVLLDAPCSATGTIRRHPDVVLHKGEKDIKKLSGLQKRLLKKAVDMVKVGGTIIYAVCSLQKEEGEEIVNQVLQEDKRLEKVSLTEAMLKIDGKDEKIGLITKEGYLRSFPFMLEGMDGFFAAKLIRKV